MRFRTDDDELSLTIELDDEPAAVDLRAGGLGEKILRFAAGEIHHAAINEQSPTGQRWPQLKARTIADKGNSLIGINTGSMLAALDDGDIEVNPRSATWSYPKGSNFPKAHGFHNGRKAQRNNQADPQPPRPLFQWSDNARLNAETLVDAFRE
jgi:hypothetical protein